MRKGTGPGKKLLARINLCVLADGSVVLQPEQQSVAVQEGVPPTEKENDSLFPEYERGPGKRIPVKITSTYLIDGQTGKWPLKDIQNLSRSDLYSLVAERIAAKEKASKSIVRNTETRATQRIVKFASKHGITIS